MEFILRNLLKILLCFFYITTVNAKPFFSITTSNSFVQIQVGSAAVVTYNVLNTSGIFTKNIVYDVNYPNNTGITIAPGTTCGSTLRVNEQCTLNLSIVAGNTLREIQLKPRICSDNGVVCSVPDSNNRALVRVIPVPLTLQVDNLAADQHLQLRPLILTNSGTTPVSLNSISVVASSSIQNQIQICNATSGCMPVAGSQPACSTTIPLTSGNSCLIWIRAIDLADQPLGNLSGTITVTLETYPITQVNQNTFNVNYNNELYAGGAFTMAGGVAQTIRVSKWNGSEWTALSSGISNGAVNSFSLFLYDLMIGGTFTNIGNANGDRVVRWDGLNYNPLSTGIPSGGVNAMTIYNNTLILGGDFLNAGGANGDRVVSWDGISFTALSIGIGNGTVSAATVYQNELIIGGSFTNVGGVNGDRIVTWDGVSFNPLSTGISNGASFSLFSFNDMLYVGGSFTNQYGATGDRIISWNGTAFSPLSLVLAPNNSVRALTNFGTNLILGGNFTNLGSIDGDRIVAWDGANYSALDTGIGNGVVNALSVAQNTNLFVGGTFTNPTSRIAQWNGAAWNGLSTGTNNNVNALMVASSLDLT